MHNIPTLADCNAQVPTAMTSCSSGDTSISFTPNFFFTSRTFCTKMEARSASTVKDISYCYIRDKI